jgi:hypothetical protein
MVDRFLFAGSYPGQYDRLLSRLQCTLASAFSSCRYSSREKNRLYQHAPRQVVRSLDLVPPSGDIKHCYKLADHLWGKGVVNEKVVLCRSKASKEPFGGQELVTNLTVYSTRGPTLAGHMEQYCSSFITAPLESAGGDGAVLIPFIFS